MLYVCMSMLHVMLLSACKVDQCLATSLSNLLLSSCPDQEFDHALNDALMRFFDHCSKFVEEVDNNASALGEMDKFKEGPEMRRVQEKIADRLRVPYSSITDGKKQRSQSLHCFKADPYYYTHSKISMPELTKLSPALNFYSMLVYIVAQANFFFW